jgi:hypothetical protein
MPLASTDNDVRQRIFQMMCLIGGIFSCCVIAPGDFVEGLPRAISVGVFIFGAGFIGVYLASRRWQVYPYSLAALLVLGLLNYAWFFNYGSSGPVLLVFFCAPMLFTIIFQGWTRWFFDLVLWPTSCCCTWWNTNVRTGSGSILLTCCGWRISSSRFPSRRCFAF